MRCPSCGSENAVEARFCAHCGYRLEETLEPQGAPTSGLASVYIPTRDLGELISETFNVYTDGFRQFVLIAIVATIPSILSSFLQPFPFPGTDPISGEFDPKSLELFTEAFSLVGIVLIIASLFTYALAGGAAVHAVAQQQLGRQVRFEESITRAWRKIGVLALTILLFMLIMLGSGMLMIVIIGIPLFFYLLVALFFYMPAIMLERNDIIGSLGRSRQLVAGSWWRIFGIGIVFILLLLGLSLAASIPMVIFSLISPFLATIFSAVVNILLFPIVIIGMTLVYIDLRVRKEGYTLTQMVYEVDPLR